MEFRTIKKDGQVQEEIKKSRFICHIKRVTTEDEAREFINTIKKEHYKATHNCSAFILGERSEMKPPPFFLIRGEDIYEPDNQKLLFPVTS